MNKHFLLLLLAICADFSSNAQCPSGAFVLANQAEVDAFPTNWPSCTNPTGRFVIGADPTVPPPHPTSDITDLMPLAQIIGFGNHTYIYNNPLLISLNGLHNVAQVTGDFTVQANHALTDLTGLGALTSVQDLLKIENNNGLETLNGLGGGFTNLEALVIIENDNLTSLGTVLDNLQTVDEYILFNLNSSLTSINTMNNLTSVGHYLSIENNASLVSLDAFNNLAQVGLGGTTWDFEVAGHPNLLAINDFINLSQVGKNFEISNNADLTDLSFPGLTSVGGLMSITSNVSLTSLLGLEDFDLTGALFITGNSALPECEAQGVCDYLAGPGPATISGNALGCATVAAVEIACAALPVTLAFFEGKNDNGDVLLTWQTASEKNNDHFQIEHSQDGVHFKAVGNVPGNGTSTSPNNYSFHHPHPARGNNYYRLRQVDFDGHHAYSHIVSIEMAHGIHLEVYPNPTTGYVKLKGDIPTGTARLTDITGQLIVERHLPEEYLIDLTTQPEGVYLIEIQTGSEKIVKRVVKQ